MRSPQSKMGKATIPMRSAARSRRIHSLADIELTSEEKAALSRQGFVGAEKRGERGPYYRLHFRLHGRQTTRYLGRDPAVAERIRNELAVWQHNCHLARRIARLHQEARRVIRESKARMGPLVLEAGYQFHGFTLRRPRGSSAQRLGDFSTNALGQPISGALAVTQPRINCKGHHHARNPESAESESHSTVMPGATEASPVPDLLAKGMQVFDALLSESLTKAIVRRPLSMSR